ncbi:tetratricopeptide repeat protein [Salinispira pacifica]|uniref:RelA/SpoT domain protein n=1 Tax=Salinispira pacifica TaxID=1307761 RepID=V5WKZ9_9SPIO|nr:tetratricopeptide repeat protein [Salinispira pacifica]AHC16320.1 RelA/SpoT domain protein [Salinispira pacifica]
MVHVTLPVKARHLLQQEYEEHVDSFERALYELHRRLRSLLDRKRIRATVKYRVKSFSSYYQKIQRRSSENGQHDSVLISDVLGIRIVCPFIDDLTAVENMLTGNFSIREREKKGAEFSFKEFGYDSLHFLINLPEDLTESFHLSKDLVTEIQLRTILQDAWAEVEHEMVYKSQITPFDVNLRRKLAALNANLSLSDMIFHEIRVYQRELQHQLDRRRVAFMSMVQSQDMEEDAKTAPPADSLGSFPDHPLLQSVSTETQESQLLKALYAHNAHHYETAIEIYERILSEDAPESIRTMVFLHRGMALFAVSRYEEAETDFRSSLEVNPENERAHHYLGLTLRQLGREQEALIEFDSCLALNGGNNDALLSRAQLYYSMGNYSDAISDCDKVLNTQPGHNHARKFREFITGQLGM